MPLGRREHFDEHMTDLGSPRTSLIQWQLIVGAQQIEKRRWGTRKQEAGQLARSGA